MQTSGEEQRGHVLLIAGARATHRRTVQVIPSANLAALTAVPVPVLLGSTQPADLVHLDGAPDQNTMLIRLRTAAAASGPLLVYLAGQLTVDRKNHRLHLAAAGSSPATTRYTALPWEWVHNELRQRRGPTTVLVDMAADKGAWTVLHELGGPPEVNAEVYGVITPPGLSGTADGISVYTQHVIDLLRSQPDRPSNARLHALAASAAPSRPGRSSCRTPRNPPPLTRTTPQKPSQRHRSSGCSPATGRCSPPCGGGTPSRCPPRGPRPVPAARDVRAVRGPSLRRRAAPRAPGAMAGRAGSVPRTAAPDSSPDNCPARSRSRRPTRAAAARRRSRAGAGPERRARAHCRVPHRPGPPGRPGAPIRAPTPAEQQPAPHAPPPPAAQPAPRHLPHSRNNFPGSNLIGPRPRGARRAVARTGRRPDHRPDPRPLIWQAAQAGRHDQAAEMAASWEQQALQRYGYASPQATQWAEIRPTSPGSPGVGRSPRSCGWRPPGPGWPISRPTPPKSSTRPAAPTTAGTRSSTPSRPSRTAPS
ncbi:hypothetical protein O1L55_25775 [Streptomyces albulus]|nr:hypothetical protein [Streptomyces noursei]